LRCTIGFGIGASGILRSTGPRGIGGLGNCLVGMALPFIALLARQAPLVAMRENFYH